MQLTNVYHHTVSTVLSPYPALILYFAHLGFSSLFFLYIRTHPPIIITPKYCISERI